jgi:hypothetical protein
MKYLVDVEVMVKIKNVEINVDDFNTTKMIEQAIEKGLLSRRGDRHNHSYIEVVGGGLLKNWDSRD